MRVFIGSITYDPPARQIVPEIFENNMLPARTFLADLFPGRLFNSESMTTDSQQLLADYVANGSEGAFQELVSRYIDLVYSTATRLVDGDTHRAKDVAQTVFVDLSRMASKLSPDTRLGGWLHRHTCFVARTVMRGERRRQARERQAVEMSILDNHADLALAEIAPVLDEAINELGADDRDAILLRFFERRNLRSVGEALGTSENVAQKRVARAVQELTALLRRQGYIVPAAALVAGLSAAAVKAAPAGLALSITANVFSGVGTAGSAGLTSAKVAAVAKIKVGVICATAAAGLVTVLFLQHQYKGRLRAESAPAPEPVTQQEPVASQPSEPVVLETPSPVPQARPPQPPTPAPPRVAPPVEVAVPQPRQNVAMQQQTAVDYPNLPLQRFGAVSGSKIRIEGTANIIHPTWQVESPVIAGMLELGPGYSFAAGTALPSGPVPAQAHVFIMVRSLKSVENDGRPYSDRMDEVMYGKLKSEQYPKINFDLLDFMLKGVTNINGVLQYDLEAHGELCVAGVTNEITMPVSVLPAASGKIIVSGSTPLKMTSFGVEPVDVNLVVGHIKVADDVNIKFDWVVSPRKASSDLTQSQSGLVPLILDLPAPAFKGIPKDLLLGPNIEPLSDKPRPPLMVPADVANLAPGSRITCSDRNVSAYNLARLADGDKEASEKSIIFLRKGPQWVQMDFGTPQELFAVVIWHAHNMAKVYRDVIVQVADNPDFKAHVRTLFNNGRDNSSSHGVGTSRDYVETYEGKLINARGIKARYIRFYSNGSTESALNEYTEIEVYGRRAR
jgi:RNA polymerase sigma factor (sigma-70 family)